MDFPNLTYLDNAYILNVKYESFSVKCSLFR